MWKIISSDYNCRPAIIIFVVYLFSILVGKIERKTTLSFLCKPLLFHEKEEEN